MYIAVRNEKKYRIRRRIVSCVLGLLGGIGLGLLSLVVAPLSDAAPDAVCEEDMTCWDCQTMGNKVCGDTTNHVINVNGQDYIVTDNGEILGEINEP